MSLFVLDTAGNKDLLSKNVLNNSVKISGKTSEIVEKIKPQNIVEQINYLDNENESDDEDIGEGNDYFGNCLNMRKLIKILINVLFLI